jgi:hypothetical protein
MKNLRIKWNNLLFNLMVAVLFVALGFGLTGQSLFIGVMASLCLGVLLGFTKVSARSALYMAVQKEIWEKDIEEAIFKDNGFLRFCFNATDYVIGNAVVHIPQSGGPGAVVKNRAVFPAAIRTRNDTDVVYVLDNYSSDPVKIPYIDKYELSYDKRNSVLGEDKNNLVQNCAEGILYNWVTSPLDGTVIIPPQRILRTTGVPVLAANPGATGNRLSYSLTDLQALQTKLRTENRWFEGKMNYLGTPSAIAQMFPADSLITATYMASVSPEEKAMGLIARAQGFNIWSRSSVYTIASDGTIKAPGAITADDDNEASIAWYSESVEQAFGEVYMFAHMDSPTEYGDVYSFIVRIGGRARRAGYEGLYLMQQAPAA